MKTLSLAEPAGFAERCVSVDAAHWRDCLNARHPIPPDPDSLAASGGEKGSLRELSGLEGPAEDGGVGKREGYFAASLGKCTRTDSY
jgi:hypothetical protein